MTDKPTSRLACKLCVLQRGITIKDTFATEAELEAHLRAEHPEHAKPLFARGLSDTGRIPVEAATKLLADYGLLQVIIVAWDGAKTHVTTDGATLGDGDMAAEGGKLVRQALGWPPEQWKHVDSARVAKLLERVRHLCDVADNVHVELTADESQQLKSASDDVRLAMQQGWRP